MTDTNKILRQIEKAFKPKPPKQQQKLTPKQLAQMAKVKSSIHLFRLKLATLDRVKDESDQLIQELIKTFIQQIPKQITQATSGLTSSSDEHGSGAENDPTADDLAPSTVDEQTVKQSSKGHRESHDTEHSDR
ncbi:hypothetical protein [Vibrio gazogenes]|uniref:Uncharacterized protein n=1 Tax=Vibrio gazogenes DSM 21264 = NBRC 103151 TaxID=1123492 RepID=A0A1M5HHZ6_VIBGA|nr:hypothetical protein [Vibrio gazogenes]USP13262.1 hypothetical protein MKS89_12705 [Vibrio gazogenes]SHG15555.1 hypothetical protein SAMN02745781_04104 [Vibrio gazogenes DSM 21264] [Vibrio gazogenes DSM 21264 = NBRC 103151]SJN56711.1 hypothetical protein BQ6471_02171 [Vibrio gazogenes]